MPCPGAFTAESPRFFVTSRLKSGGRRRKSFYIVSLSLLWFGVADSQAAPPNRITRAVDARRSSAIAGHIHRFAQPQFDQGAVDPGMRMNYIVTADQAVRGSAGGARSLAGRSAESVLAAAFASG